MKKFLAIAATAAALIAGSAQATQLLTNGTFAAGNTGFQSQYSYQVLNGAQTNLWPEGTYDVSSDPNADHYLFTSFHDHTPDSMMMVVNGSGEPNKVIWSEGQFAGMPVAGTALAGPAFSTFTFSFWLAKVYPASPADLQLWINGTKMTAVSATTGDSPQFLSTQPVAVWQHFSYTGRAGADGIKLIGLTNNNTALSGNDFALDDMSLVASVPEPASWALMLMGFMGLGAMVRANRRRMATAA